MTLGRRSEHSEGTRTWERVVFAPPQLAFRILCMIGGRFGYFGAERAFALYRHAQGFRPSPHVDTSGAGTPGEGVARIDGWTVLASEPHRLLEMQMVSGSSELRVRWEIEPRPGGRSLVKQKVIRTGEGVRNSVCGLLDGRVWSRVFLGFCNLAEIQGAGGMRERPAGALSLLRRETIVPRGLEETFRFFADAGNLQQLTPPWVNFRIITPLPIPMGVGVLIDYQIRIHGVPVAWKTQITCWEPPYRFVDQQLKGPYRWWHHEHRFEACEGGTRVIDEVEYSAILGWLTEPLFVRSDVERIFTFREKALHQALGDGSAANTPQTHVATV